MSDVEDVLFEKSFKMQKTMMEVLFKAIYMKTTVENCEGETARWVERELTSLIKIITDGTK
jgi:hypothetical protein